MPVWLAEMVTFPAQVGSARLRNGVLRMDLVRIQNSSRSNFRSLDTGHYHRTSVRTGRKPSHELFLREARIKPPVFPPRCAAPKFLTFISELFTNVS
jgi:hypothetical protein